MPPSSRRTRSQREPEQAEQSEADTPESIPTPSRKRRRLNGAAASRSATDAPAPTRHVQPFESVENVKGAETKDIDLLEEGPLTPDKVVVIIQSLRKPKYITQVSLDHANEVHFRDNPNARPAYAKISGRDWTYFVNKKRVIIGRPVEAAQRSSNAVRGGETGSPVASLPDANFEVDIDLGPDKMVSRVHAEISFDSDTYNWIVHVNGRNGLYLDDTKLARGARAVLHSGSVLNIHDSQMMFLTADSEVVVHNMFRKQAWIEQDDATDEEGEEDPQIRLTKPSKGMKVQDATGQTSQPRHQSSQQQRDHLPPRESLMTLGYTAPDASMSTQPATPIGVRAKDGHSKPKQSPANIRGMLLESTEDIDYSLDSAKDLKPPRSYASLIGQAIMASDEQKLTLAKIYDFIKEHYAYYRLSSNIGWQNSIRHNLSLNKCFEKVARRTDEPGKGMKWQIVPEYRDEFITKGMSNTRKGMNRTGSSGPSSPAGKDLGSTQATERLLGALNRREAGRDSLKGDKLIKTSPRSVTPPISSFPIANESYTPDRGPRMSFAKHEQSGINGGQMDHFAHTPVFTRSQSSLAAHSQPSFAADSAIKGTSGVRGLTDAATMSPPTLSSSMYSGGHALETPLVPRQQPRLAPPSTAHLPSHFMLFSSPAPFWKFADLGSTPARPPPLDLSPTKSVPGQEADGNLQSSSPPTADGLGIGREAELSPTRTLSRPASRRDGPGLPLAQPVIGVPSGLGIVEEDEEGGIDLAKGFQKIGSFHSHRNLAGLSGEIRGV